MKTELLESYKDWAKKVSEKLKEDNSWVELYKSYAINMLKNEEKFKNWRNKFRNWTPFHLYLTVGNTEKGKCSFDLRYLGQSVGVVTIENKDNVFLTVKNEKNIKRLKSNEEYFGYNLGEIIKADWNSSKKAKEFRKFFRDHKKSKQQNLCGKKQVCQEEHMVECALFSELGKDKSKDKTLCNITPISFAGTRIHMKTALAASDAKNGDVKISKRGGEIDLFCRRRTGNRSRLVVIEIKDKNEKGESFDEAMYQAISYAVFISELLHSDKKNCENWMKLWGMENQQKVIDKQKVIAKNKTGYIIDCVVAMPSNGDSPSYNGEIIELENDDKLELHYMKITSDINRFNSDDVKFETSIK